MSFRDFQSNEWHDVEKIIETKGSKSLIKKPVGSPYSKRCKKVNFKNSKIIYKYTMKKVIMMEKKNMEFHINLWFKFI